MSRAPAPLSRDPYALLATVKVHTVDPLWTPTSGYELYLIGKYGGPNVTAVWHHHLGRLWMGRIHDRRPSMPSVRWECLCGELGPAESDPAKQTHDYLTGRWVRHLERMHGPKFGAPK